MINKKLDGYLNYVPRSILGMGLNKNELAFWLVSAIVANHPKSKKPGLVTDSTTILGKLMGASQMTAWRCKKSLAEKGLIQPTTNGFIILTKEIKSSGLINQGDYPLIKGINTKSRGLKVNQGDYKPNTNQIGVIINKSNKVLTKEQKAPLFEEWLNKIINSKNPIGALGEMIMLLTGRSPPFERIGVICKQLNNDYGYVCKLCWEAASARPAGDFLSYIQGRIKNEKNRRALGRVPERYSTPEEIDRQRLERH